MGTYTYSSFYSLGQVGLLFMMMIMQFNQIFILYSLTSFLLSFRSSIIFVWCHSRRDKSSSRWALALGSRCGQLCHQLPGFVLIRWSVYSVALSSKRQQCLVWRSRPTMASPYIWRCSCIILGLECNPVLQRLGGTYRSSNVCTSYSYLACIVT